MLFAFSNHFSVLLIFVLLKPCYIVLDAETLEQTLSGSLDYMTTKHSLFSMPYTVESKPCEFSI